LLQKSVIKYEFVFMRNLCCVLSIVSDIDAKEPVSIWHCDNLAVF